MSTSSRSTAELQLKFFIERYRGSFGAVRLQSVWEILLHNYSPHISTTDRGQYTACTPQPPTINPRLRNIFIERGGGVICRLSTANAWGNFARSRPLHISTSHQGQYITVTPKSTTMNPIPRRNVFCFRCAVCGRVPQNCTGKFGRSKFTATTHQHPRLTAVHCILFTTPQNELHFSPKAPGVSVVTVVGCKNCMGKFRGVKLHDR